MIDVMGGGRGELVANPDMLVVSREAIGLTQRELADRLTELASASPQISQGYVSRAEKGALEVAGERLALFAAGLECTTDLLAAEAKVWSLGEGCLYHRNRASAKASTLRRLHARVNLLRLYLHRLAAAGRVALPTFDLVPMRLGGLDGPEDAARALRSRLGVPDGPVESVTGLAEQSGALVVSMSLGAREVDATSLHPSGEPPVFVINSDAPADRQRFTLAHELGHTACTPAEDMDAEEMAQSFASELLMPASLVRADLLAAPITPARLLQLKGKWRTSAAALLRRAVDLAVITDSRYRSVSTQMSALGWRTAEPEPLPSERCRQVPNLVRTAVRAVGGYEEAAVVAGTTEANLRVLLGTDLIPTTQGASWND
jgi:Zn-dependent peptidase ImmA (M78 family)/transcriptional regulator with XRE-family HTH domain